MTAPQVLLVVGIVAAYLVYVVSWLRRRRDVAPTLPPIEPRTPLNDFAPPPLGGHASPLSGWEELPPHQPLPDSTHLPDGHGGHGE